ncbi:hypothetical protein EG329_012338 [Mollisiaceae sp. DMI_Dod_QoI]|nr:hypothetical protein EG329_012338 [Helotiales sp. DMI_Dod_QoI]
MSCCCKRFRAVRTKKSRPTQPPDTQASRITVLQSSKVSGTPTPGLTTGESQCEGSPSPSPPAEPLPEEHRLREPSVLWSDAYDAVINGDPDLAKAYERILIRIVSENPESLSDPLNDSRPRREELEDAVQKGLERTERWQKAIKSTGDILGVVMSAKDIISNVLSVVPHAAAAWTGIMLVFEGFSNAAIQSKTNREGVIYVSSRVQWYRELYQVAAAEDVGLRRLLEEKLIDLYKKVLTYQMRSVGCYYRNQLERTVLDAFKVDDWEAALKDVRDAEDKLRQDASDYYRKMQRAHLSELENSAKVLQERVPAQLDKILEVNTAILGANTEILGQLEDDAEKAASKEASLTIGKFLPEGLDYKSFMDKNPDPEQGTCNWFLDDDRVNSWEVGLLLVTAIPGQGKSVLAKFLVHHWGEGKPNPTVCHFFFKETSEVQRKSASGFCALVHQIFAAYPKVAELPAVQNGINALGPALATSVTSLLEALELVLSHINEREVIIVLDALDECDSSELPSLERLVTFCETHNVKILATSRPDNTVNLELKINTRRCVRLDLKDRSEELGPQIDRVIDRRVQELAPHLGWSSKLQERLKRQLKARGPQQTYLWLRLIFDYLKKKTRRSDDDWIALIKTFSGINETYEALLADVDPELIPAIQGLFSFMIAAPNPPHLAEINIALNISLHRDTKKGYMNDDESMAAWIEENSGLLVAVYGRRAQFIHQTVKEFLTKAKKAGEGYKIEDEAKVTSLVWEGLITKTAAHHWMGEVCRRRLDYATKLWIQEWCTSESIPIWTEPKHQTQSERFLLYALHEYPYYNNITYDELKPSSTLKSFSLSSYKYAFDNEIGERFSIISMSRHMISKEELQLARKLSLDHLAASILSPAQIQDVIWRRLEQVAPNNMEGILVSKVYRVMIREWNWNSYVVKENIIATKLSIWLLGENMDGARVDRVTIGLARAVNCFLSFPPSEKVLFEPIYGKSGGYRLGIDGIDTDYIFGSVKELEEFINKVLSDASDSSTSPLQVNFAGKAYFCFHPRGLLNGVLVGSEGTLYLDDFSDVAVLPVSFMLYALDTYKGEYATVIRNLRSKLNFPDERDNVVALARAYELFKERGHIFTGQLQNWFNYD